MITAVIVAPIACANGGQSIGSLGPGPAGDDAAVNLGDEFRSGDGPTSVDSCHVAKDSPTGNAPTCKKAPPPPNSFDPVLLWSWTAPVASGQTLMGSIVMPLVGELVDTDHNGEVNLCDVPSVIVKTFNPGPSGDPFNGPYVGQIVMLAGDTGAVQATFVGTPDPWTTPALGDIDGDGISEIVTNDMQGHVIAYDNKGKLKWTGPDIIHDKQAGDLSSYCLAIAIYDLDGDGNPEIIDGFEVFDNHGKSKFFYDETSFSLRENPFVAPRYYCPAPTAADLDGDGKQEVIFGNAALHWDGSVYWTIPGAPGQPQVADFDKDGIPEIFTAREDGLLIISHDGKILSGPLQSFDPQVYSQCWTKAGAVADFDGTGHASVMDSSCTHFGIWHVSNTFQMSLQWSAPVSDPSGIAASGAFDFLGRGTPEAVYGDENNLWVFNGKSGSLEFSQPRSSGTLIEYPVVADVNNDGAADIVVVSNNSGQQPGNYKHTVDVWTDKSKRWIPTRRIWNQHAYHVTNVREDGTIPAHQANSWQKLNTFRVNSQIENGGDCAPPPPTPN